jgi:DNA repair protein SbcC/Rad50
MRILRISLRNIASLAGTHTIDFTRDPLRTAGLFSISGSTGSGKSTVLDALCLALYERTPRLDAVRGATKLPDAGDLISQSDPSNLLRRGSGEGFAEVAFVGVDGITYTAQWKVRRAHNRSDGALQKTELTLCRGDVRFEAPGVIEQGGKKSEVLPAIASKVGLSFEQFTRAVLLAQNEFATFLKADDRERAGILQALTGTERFDAISRSIFERYSIKKREIEALEAQLQGNSPLDSAQRAEAESALIVADRAFKEATENLLVRQKHAAWYRRLSELSREVANAQALVAEAARERDAGEHRRLELAHTEKASREARALWDAEYRANCEIASSKEASDRAAEAEAKAAATFHFSKEKYEKANATLVAAKLAAEVAQPQLRLARDLDASLLFLAGQFATATRERKLAEAVVHELAGRRDTLTRERQEAEAEIFLLSQKREALAWLSPFAPDAAAWRSRIDQAIEARSAFTDAQRDLMGRIGEEQRARKLWEVEQAREPALRAQTEAAISDLAEADKAACAYDPEKISAERREIELTRSALCNLQNHLVNLESLSGRARSFEDEIHQLRTENQVDRQTLVDLREHRIPAAETALKFAQHSFELAEAAVTDSTIRLREKLVPGLQCPVCGALEHPFAEHPPTSEVTALRALRDECSAKERELIALRNKEAGLTIICETRENLASEKNRALNEVRSQLETLSSIHHEHPEAAAIVAMPATERATRLMNRIAAQDRFIESLDALDRARFAAEKKRDACRTLRESAIRNLASLEKRLAEIAGALGRVQSSRESAESVCNKAAATLKNRMEQLKLLFDSRFRSESEPNVTGFREEFCAGMIEFQALEKRANALVSVIGEQRATLFPVQEALDRAETECQAKRSAEAFAQSACDDVRKERASILGGRPADAVEGEINENLYAATKRREDCAEEAARAERDFIIASQKHRTALNGFEASNLRSQTAARELDAWFARFAEQAGRTLDRPALGTMLSRDAVWIRTERSALEGLEATMSKAEGALAVHEKTFQEHVANRSTTEDETKVEADVVRLRSVLMEAEQRRDIARTVVHADDQRRAACVNLTREVEDRRDALKPWEKLNELIGSADGAKFRSIAQRRTLDVLLGYANVQLNQLAGRYSLARVSESLNLYVLDRDMGDERRSVHTLSGGESFLVSLALALGLASLTANRLRIESLFIDEGFGSLDPETMNTAMSALMSLEAQGRKVGVISHVPEMADAIPVQIRVTKGRNGASRIIVPGAARGQSVARLE